VKALLCCPDLIQLVVMALNMFCRNGYTRRYQGHFTSSGMLIMIASTLP
jgi:hypothetical protein